jgi:enoyl-CoA hydratase/carnithine racemase
VSLLCPLLATDHLLLQADNVAVMPTLTVAVDGGVAQIVLSRPEALNAISTELAGDLVGATGKLAADPTVRVVVLAADGDRAFCVGADLKERNGMSDAEIVAQRVVFRAAFAGLLGLPQPTVAAVHGFALGGGCELALSCDIVVADDTAVLGLPEVTIGLVPGGGGTQLALRRLGAGRAADVVLTGRRIPAAEAAAIGLVDRLVPAGSGRTAAADLAATIAGNSPVAVRAAKRALRAGWGLDYMSAMEVEDAAWRTAATSADRREGIAAFNEKRRPVWPGR